MFTGANLIRAALAPVMTLLSTRLFLKLWKRRVTKTLVTPRRLDTHQEKVAEIMEAVKYQEDRKETIDHVTPVARTNVFHVLK